LKFWGQNVKVQGRGGSKMQENVLLALLLMQYLGKLIYCISPDFQH